MDSTTEFTVDARSVVPRGGKVKAFVSGPTGTRTEALVNNNNDGTYKCMYTPYEQGTSPPPPPHSPVFISWLAQVTLK